MNLKEDNKTPWNLGTKEENPQNVIRGFGNVRQSCTVARGVVSRVVRITVSRWRLLVGIQDLQPRPCDLNDDLFAADSPDSTALFQRQIFPRLFPRSECIFNRTLSEMFNASRIFLRIFG
ncbi:hypothetical protein KM043_017035 [Ampulex compressa]|nr:hypothetical protein KM043_017035 [Ampulex compressa]